MEGTDLPQKKGWCHDGTSFSTAQPTREAENKCHEEDRNDGNGQSSFTGSTVNTTMKTNLAGREHRGDESTAQLRHVLFSSTTTNGSRGRTISTLTTTATEESSSNSSIRTKKPIWTFDMDSVQPCTEIVSSSEKTDGDDDHSFPPLFDEFFDKSKNSGIFSSSPTCAEDIDDVLSFYMLNSLKVKSKRQNQQDEGGNEPNNSTTGQQYRTEGGGLTACSRHDETTPRTSNRRRVSQDTSMKAGSATELSATARIATNLFSISTSTSTAADKNNTTNHDEQNTDNVWTSTGGTGGNRLDTNVVVYGDDDGTDAHMFVGKRIEVQWTMSDGRREWFAGTVSNIEKDGRTAFINYDDGDSGPIQNGTHPRYNGEFQLWRTAILEQPSGSPTTNFSDIQQQVQQRKVYGGWPVTSATQSWNKKKKKKNKDSKNTSDSKSSSELDEKETNIYESSLLDKRPTNHTNLALNSESGGAMGRCGGAKRQAKSMSTSFSSSSVSSDKQRKSTVVKSKANCINEPSTGDFSETTRTASEHELEVARRRKMKRQKYGTKWVCRRWPPKCLTAPKKSSL